MGFVESDIKQFVLKIKHFRKLSSTEPRQRPPVFTLVNKVDDAIVIRNNYKYYIYYYNYLLSLIKKLQNVFFQRPEKWTVDEVDRDFHS